jgi:hypothetical protein
MRRWWGIVVVGLLVALAACGDDDTTETGDGGDEAGEDVVEFTWVTTLDQDGFGYVLTVDGFVGEGHAAYTMQVEPLLAEGGGDYEDYLALIAGAAVNGFAGPGEGVETEAGDDISLDGRTEVRVIGDDRWYRNPWLLQEAEFAMGDAEWVRVDRAEDVIADIVTAVLNERYDDAVRRLLDTVGSGATLEAPTPAEDSVELDEMLTPWIGLAGPAYPIGAGAETTGDTVEGEARWTQLFTYEPDGADGEMGGVVRWTRGRAQPPEAPAAGDVIDVAEVTAGLGG